MQSRMKRRRGFMQASARTGCGSAGGTTHCSERLLHSAQPRAQMVARRAALVAAALLAALLAASVRRCDAYAGGAPGSALGARALRRVPASCPARPGGGGAAPAPLRRRAWAPVLRMGAGAPDPADRLAEAEAALDDAIAASDVNAINKWMKAIERLQAEGGAGAGAKPYVKKMSKEEETAAIQELLGCVRAASLLSRRLPAWRAWPPGLGCPPRVLTYALRAAMQAHRRQCGRRCGGRPHQRGARQHGARGKGSRSGAGRGDRGQRRARHCGGDAAPPGAAGQRGG